MRHLIRFDGEQRPNPLVQILFGAMIGVQGNRIRVCCGDFMRERGERERPGDPVVDPLPGEVGGPAYGHLDDTVGFSIGEALQCGVQGLRAGHVDSRVSIAAATRRIEHLGIPFRGCDSHDSIIPHTMAPAWFEHGVLFLREAIYKTPVVCDNTVTGL